MKPSTPTEETRKLIQENANTWATRTLSILRDHYEEIISTETEKLENLNEQDPDWMSPFDVAADWARRSLGKRLLQDTIQQAEDHFSGYVSPPPTPSPARTPAAERETTCDPNPPRVTIGTDTTDLVPAQALQQSFSVAPIRTSGQSAVQDKSGEGPRMQSVRPLGGTGPTTESTCHRTMATVATMTDPPEPQLDWSVNPPQVGSPQEPRVARKCLRKTKHLTLEEDGGTQEEIREGIRPVEESIELELDALFEDEQGEDMEIDEDGTLRPRGVLQVPQGATGEEEEEEGWEDSVDHLTEPGPPSFQVIRHPSTLRKLIEWEWVVKKAILIGGFQSFKTPRVLP